jgi:glycogen debranching enzyme
MPDPGRQPLLHDLITCVASPTAVLSGQDGQIRATGAQGAFVADVRVISRAELTVDGAEPEPVVGAPAGAGQAEFMAVVRSLGDDIADPTVWVRRSRVAHPAGCAETITLTNVTATPISTTIALQLAGDLAEIETVKSGGAGSPVPFRAAGSGFVLGGPRLTAHVVAQDAAAGAADATASGTDGGGQLRWDVTVPARGRASVGWSVRVDDPDAVVVPAGGPSPFVPPTVAADDRRLAPFVTRAVEDLAALRMSTTDRPGDQFLAAGAPWYLTLFGRDSIWAARMLLPLGTGIAGGTLRTLAARQGNALDDQTAEEPGKILHELRRGEFALGSTALPPVYYGTVDASPLWVCLLADAWRWGMDEAEVGALLPAAERALAWMAEYGDSDGDGLLEYIDRSGRGLANQGWKDSGDSVRFADGRIADGPVALAEVQGYAHEAALAGADLLDAFGRPGADRWREYAAGIAAAFRDRFWVSDELGRYPAMALDGSKRPVDAPASNMGHLLSSGMLTPAEAGSIADRLVHPSMSSGFGLRTMSTATGGYSPLSYHCGSVWPHDTAIAIHGLIRAGFAEQAAVLAEGLLAAGAAFDGRMPELYGGFDRGDIGVPVPYPAACRPQAWSAAAAVTILQAFLGVQADVPGGVVRVAPSPRIGAVTATGLRVAGRELRITVSADGSASAEIGGGARWPEVRVRGQSTSR